MDVFTSDCSSSTQVFHKLCCGAVSHGSSRRQRNSSSHQPRTTCYDELQVQSVRQTRCGLTRSHPDHHHPCPRGGFAPPDAPENWGAPPPRPPGGPKGPRGPIPRAPRALGALGPTGGSGGRSPPVFGGVRGGEAPPGTRVVVVVGLAPKQEEQGGIFVCFGLPV